MTSSITRNSCARLSILAAALLSLAIPGHAAPIFDNFGPGNTYNTTVGWAILGADIEFVETSMQFIPSETFTLAEIDAAVTHTFGTNALQLSLRSDNFGFPDQVITSWLLTGLPDYGACCEVVSVFAASTIVLDAGTPYWIVATPGAGDAQAVWMFNTTNSIGQVAQFVADDGIGVNTTDLGAFRVLATPEPSTALIAAAGLLALAAARRRHSV